MLHYVKLMSKCAFLNTLSDSTNNWILTECNLMPDLVDWNYTLHCFPLHRFTGENIQKWYLFKQRNPPFTIVPLPIDSRYWMNRPCLPAQLLPAAARVPSTHASMSTSTSCGYRVFVGWGYHRASWSKQCKVRAKFETQFETKSHFYGLIFTMIVWTS